MNTNAECLLKVLDSRSPQVSGIGARDNFDDAVRVAVVADEKHLLPELLVKLVRMSFEPLFKIINKSLSECSLVLLLLQGLLLRGALILVLLLCLKS